MRQQTKIKVSAKTTYGVNWIKTQQKEELTKAQEALIKMKAIEAKKLSEAETMQVFTGERGLKVICRADSDKKKALTRDQDFWKDRPLGSYTEGAKIPRVNISPEERAIQRREYFRRYNEKVKAQKQQQQAQAEMSN